MEKFLESLKKVEEDREKAIKWLNSLNQYIADVCEAVYGEIGTIATNPDATLVKYGRCHVVNVWEMASIMGYSKPQKRNIENLLYRYKGIIKNYPGAEEEKNKRWATVGFIVGDESYGKLLVETEGTVFWDNFKKVVEWIPLLADELDIEENRRAELLSLVNI